MRWRSNGACSCPLVMRVPIGGYLTGGSIYHSQSGESIFTHTPGVRVVMPSNALDARGCCGRRSAATIRCCFWSTSGCIARRLGAAAYPGPEYAIPFGKAKIVRPGKDLTVVTYGAVVPRALQAAERLHREAGVDVEVIDLRSLSPYDWEAIAESVRKTSKVIVAHEDMLSWGYGAEIAARIGDELFHDSGCAGAAGGGDGYVCGVPADAGGRDSAAGRRICIGRWRSWRSTELDRLIVRRLLYCRPEPNHLVEGTKVNASSRATWPSFTARSAITRPAVGQQFASSGPYTAAS